jgi:hypothetical protein
MTIQAERTIRYKTYIKRALVEALRPVLANHPDNDLRDTKVTIDFPMDKASYPSIIVRFFEREVKNIGVGHVEFIVQDGDSVKSKFKHYLYTGDVEFAIYGLSSLDRDLIADTVVQTLTMGDLTTYTNNFINRIYFPNATAHPDSVWNYVNLNTDRIQGFGETQVPAPWQPEDVLLYQTSYRIGIFGEFYSLPPDIPDVQEITSVNFYPYMGGLEPVPEGTVDDAPWE